MFVEEELEVLRKAELSREADSENYHGGSSEKICHMQWQTIADGKATDMTERYGR